MKNRIEASHTRIPDGPILVGERTNVAGSRLFQKLIAEERFEEAVRVAQQQIEKGAQMIDVCLQDPNRDEVTDMRNFLSHLTKKVRSPLMIDSTDPEVMEAALPYCRENAILNSVNLKDGGKSLQQVIPLVKKFGASIVAGTIDEKGPAVTRENKLKIVQRTYHLLVTTHGVNPRDIIFDLLVFPCGTGDPRYVGAARESIESIGLIQHMFSHCKTLLGISNVSFGLPRSGRKVLDSVFLHHSSNAGLDMAIVNTERLMSYLSIPQREKDLAELVLFESSKESTNRFIEYFE